MATKKMKKKAEKKTGAAAEAKAAPKKAKQYVMFGFEEANPDNVAYLKVGHDGVEMIAGVYSVVADAKEATKFASENTAGKVGFAPPDKWAEFFAQEDELKEWNFHPVPYAELK
jgi:hypothetical protein